MKVNWTKSPMYLEPCFDSFYKFNLTKLGFAAAIYCLQQINCGQTKKESKLTDLNLSFFEKKNNFVSNIPINFLK